MRLLPPLAGLPLAGPLALLLAACSGGPVDVQTAERVPLALDRADAERLVAATLGGYAAPEGADPFAAGLASGEGRDLAVHPQRLPDSLRARLRDADGDGALSWDELAAFLEATLPAARALPPTVDALRAEAGVAPDGWFTTDVDGSVMTHARRRIAVPEAAVRAALTAAAETGRLAYPVGTWIVGEHVDPETGDVLETTAKRRRADGFWDFAVYDAAGRLAPSTTTAPRPLRAPTQCTGCHLGRRRFEPEASFPATPADGPDGPRAIRVPDAWRSAAATRRLDEHARRDDATLGIYATLYAGRLLADRDAGTLAPADAALLSRLGL